MKNLQNFIQTKEMNLLYGKRTTYRRRHTSRLLCCAQMKMFGRGPTEYCSKANPH